MQANPKTIRELFNSQLRYVVPMFQRLYVWQQTPQWETLWEDVSEKANLRLYGGEANAHYLGALIIEGVRPTSPREVKRFLVIDGQQRLTTLQLLLCAFRDLARQLDWKSIDKPISRYLENADPDVMEKPHEEIFKLWPTTLNREIFRSIVQAGSQAEVIKQYPLVYRPRKRKPELRSNLVEAYLYFFSQIQSWIDSGANVAADRSPETVAFALLQAIQEDFCVVEISLSEGDDSQEIFYSLNSQGRPLSQSDLLRSLIFIRAEKEKVGRDQLFEDYWNKFETAFWSQEIKRGGRTYSRLDLGLRFFLMAKTGALVDARRVNEEYKRWITTKPPRYPSVREELADFVRHGDLYSRYESPDVATLPCTDLRRILYALEVSTALPLIMFLELEAGLNTVELAENLAIVESFIVRRTFTGDENKEYNKFFVDLVAEIHADRGAAVAPKLLAKILSGGGTTRQWPTDEQVIEHAISKPTYGMKPSALRLILERIELSLRNVKTEKMDIEANLQVEHVMPQKWATHWPLQGRAVPDVLAAFPYFTDQDQYKEFKDLADLIRARNSTVQQLGNLTLVNRHLNPAASNAGYATKLDEYRNSILRLNRYFSACPEWDEAAIATRSKLLGQAICQIWPRPEI
jgi:hypothetical protein